MSSHSELLSTLNHLTHVSSVRLVGRTTLGFRCPASYFVLPDFHLMTASTRKGYAFSFHHDKDWPDTYREPLLREVLAHVPPTWKLIHLGDLYDVWREQKEPRAAARAIAGELTWVRAITQRGSVMVGNHDRLGAEIAEPTMLRSMIIGGKILVTHGDLFDGMEDGPDWLNATAVASPIGKLFGSREIALPHTVLAQSESDIVPLDVGSHELGPAIAVAAAGLRAGKAEVCSRFGVPKKKYDLRAVVLGHTHHARVVWSASAELLIVDGGAWVERCVPVPGWPAEPSAQVTAIAPTESGLGTDFRVYQLTVR